jgi:hypothetical protein
MRFGSPCKHVSVCRLAMAIGITAVGAAHRVEGHALASEAMATRTLRGRTGAGLLGRWLLDLEGDGRGDLAEDLRALAVRIKGRAKVVVLTDGLQQGDALPAAMGVLAGQGHDVHVVQMLSPQEFSPSATGLSGDHRLVDAETGDGPAVSVTAAVEADYCARLQGHIDMLADAARRSGVHHLLVRSDEPLEDVLRNRLRRGGLLR